MTPSRTYTDGVVVTPHYLASAAGLATLADGGNAVDAIVAANLALGVVAPYYCGYGGDLLALVWDGESLHGYRSTGRTPASASLDALRDSGESTMPVFGPHAVTVPGAPQGWFDLLERFGTRSFGALAAHARRLATRGFVVTRKGGEMFAGCRALYPGFEALQESLAGAVEGATYRQPALERTIARLAADGPDAYYRGPIGTAIVECLRAHGGRMEPGDLAGHSGEWVTPMAARFGDFDVHEMPPPTQGVTALEILRIVDGLDLGADGPDRHHLLMEATKLALADRDAHVGDPQTMQIEPGALLAADHVEARRREIDPRRARNHPSRTERTDGGTAYLCSADRDGMLVSLIQSNFTAIGSGLHVSEWGINLHNRGSALCLVPGHPNAYGPGRLPLHTLIPSMTLRAGRPSHVFGTMGGHGQAQFHAQILTRMLADGADPQDAIDAPRWEINPDSWRTGAEPRFPGEWIEDWRARGHRVRTTPRPYDDSMGHAHAIEVLADGVRAASDPRAEGAALGL